MIKTIKEHLTFEEELLVAIYYNNVEKLKWLIGMDYFNPSMVSEPQKIGKINVPLYWITICYHYMLRYENFDDVRQPVDQILSIWKEQFNLDTDELIDIKKCFNEESMPLIMKNTKLWWMGDLSLNDFLQSGAREVDYALYQGISSYDLKVIVPQLNLGGIPDAKIIDHNGNETSAYSMIKYWNNNKEFYKWEDEERVVDPWKIKSILTSGHQEMIQFLLEQSIKKRNAAPVDTFSEDLKEKFSYPYEDLSPDMINQIDEFIKEIDKTGSILAVFDEGKLFGRYDDLRHLYSIIIRKVFTDSKHIIVRVGGYSYRAAESILSIVKSMPENRIYVEYLSHSTADSEYHNTDRRIRVVGMEKYRFKSNMPIVKKAEEYDFKTFGTNKQTHNMVYYYINNIDTGWYDKNGKFCSFYNKSRGLDAITDVIMVNGHDSIMPATAALASFINDSDGDVLIAGGTTHKNRRSRSSSQKMLIESAGIKLLDVTSELI